MNIAKALILLHSPTFTGHNIRDGLGANPTNHRLKYQRVTASDKGVFPLFYQTVTRERLEKSSFKIYDLLGYVSDVEYELDVLNIGPPASFRTKMARCLNKDRSSSHVVLAVMGSHLDSFKSVERTLRKDFEEVALPLRLQASVLKVFAEYSSAYRFFESKTLPANTPFEKFFGGLLRQFQSSPFNDGVTFALNAHIRSPKLIAMNEILAIYALMYFLRSLVRYRPELLESMLATKDAWILERFIKGAPLTFPRHARCILDGQCVAYFSR